MIARLRFIKPISFNKWNITVLSSLRTFSQDLWKTANSLNRAIPTKKALFLPKRC